MSNKKPKIFLAVAGAGKTYQICNKLDINKRNLILSYTHENIANINKELTSDNKKYPENTAIMTFDSFLLRFFIWPLYKKIFTELFNKPYKNNKNLSFVAKKFDSNKLWEFSKNNFSRYFSKDSEGNFYLHNNEVPTLILNDEKKFLDGSTLFSKGIDRINLFFDAVYIDEFQDYRGDKFHLMTKIMLNVKSGFLYGDYHQHSVCGDNNNGQPFLKNTSYESYIRSMVKQGFEVDTTSMIKTRRCSENICKFVRDNLNIEIYSEESMNRSGNIDFVFDESQIKSLVADKDCTVISLQNVKEWHSISFDRSKGNTYKKTLVIISDKYLDKNGCKLKKIDSIVTKNKIYVGLTRSTGNTFVTNRASIKKCFDN